MKIIVLLAAVCLIQGQGFRANAAKVEARPVPYAGPVSHAANAANVEADPDQYFGRVSYADEIGDKEIVRPFNYDFRDANGSLISIQGSIDANGSVIFFQGGGKLATGSDDQPVAFPPKEQVITSQSGACGPNNLSYLPWFRANAIMFLNYCPVPQPVNKTLQALPCVYPFKMFGGKRQYNKPQYATYEENFNGPGYTICVCATATNLGTGQAERNKWKYICRCPTHKEGCTSDKECSGCPLRVNCLDSTKEDHDAAYPERIADRICKRN